MRSLNRHLNMTKLFLPQQSVCFDPVNLLHIDALTLCLPRSDEVGETGTLRVKRPVRSRHARASGKAGRPPERSVLLKINHLLACPNAAMRVIYSALAWRPTLIDQAAG